MSVCVCVYVCVGVCVFYLYMMLLPYKILPFKIKCKTNHHKSNRNKHI